MATIRTSYKGDMLFETQLGRHSVLIDVPPSIGGTDRGPTLQSFSSSRWARAWQRWWPTTATTPVSTPPVYQLTLTLTR